MQTALQGLRSRRPVWLINPSGSKLWRWRYRFGGKEKLVALGEYPVVNLAQARERQLAACKKLAVDLHPMAKRKAEAETDSGKPKYGSVRPKTPLRISLANGGNGGLLASLRVTLTTSCDGWKRMSSQGSVTSLSMT
jgi:Arm DNA-binding domain